MPFSGTRLTWFAAGGTRLTRLRGTVPRMIEVPEGVAALGEDVAGRVEALVRDAELRQAQELRRSLDDTLRIVPRPLRGLVKKIVGA